MAQYYEQYLADQPFQPGKTLIQHSGKVYDAREMQNMVEAVLDGWWTGGRFVEEFEKRLAKFVGVKHAIAVNSGSSANLLAFAALTSPLLGKRRIQPGDEVLTVAAGFPTTVNPIFQCGAVPVFVDIELNTLGVDVKLLEAAISPRTRAVMIAHALGNPLDMDSLIEFCKRHNLWLVEDTCDALGSTYRGRQAGSFGDIASVSFFPAHHITMGEGGIVLTDNKLLAEAVRSLLNWGRDLSDVPDGYDRSYTYTHPGYNLKTTDIQAACGVVQLDKLAEFTQRRKGNFAALHARLERYSEYFQFLEPYEGADPSWFGFSFILKDTCQFTRDTIVKYLGKHGIISRRLFAGNLTRQPYFSTYNIKHRIVGKLTNSDIIFDKLFWIGCYQGIKPEHIEYIGEVFDAFMAKQIAQPVKPSRSKARV